MNKDFTVKINGRPDYAFMLKNKIEYAALQLGSKIMSDIMPKVDDFFVNH